MKNNEAGANTIRESKFRKVDRLSTDQVRSVPQSKFHRELLVGDFGKPFLRLSLHFRVSLTLFIIH